jgi:PAS domain S-box-containing protein
MVKHPLDPKKNSRDLARKYEQFFIRFWYDDPKIKFQIYTESNYLSTFNSNFQRYYHYLGNLMISVLYVDDESALLEITKLFLEGFNDLIVETATSAQDGLGLLKEQSFDAIVSDYQMPGMDGIAFLKAVRERFGDIPFILFTGRGREEVVISAINNGADFYLQKGGDPTAQFAELSHKIRQAVGRRQAEENLRETNEYLTNLITYASGPIVTWDVDFKITRFNRAFENLTGFHEADLLGKDFDSLFPEASRVHSLDLISRALFGEKWDAVEIPVRTADEGNRTIIWNSANIYHRDGKTLVATIAQGIDITERKKTEDNLKIAYESVTAAEEELRQNYDVLSKNEEALRESEEKFRTLVENALDGILILDFQGLILFVNQAAAEIIDTENYPEMFGVRNVMEFIAPESQGDAIRDFSQIAQGIDGYLARYKIITGKNQERWVESIGKNIHFQGRSAILISLRDITQRQNAERVLQESEKKFRVLAEHSLDGIMIIDFTGNLLFINRAGGLMVDVADYQAMIGKNMMEYIAPDSQAEVLADFGKVVQGIDAYLVYYKLITETKREIWVECIGKKIPFENSEAMLVSMRDITERKRAEAVLRESENKFSTIFRNSPVVLTLVSVSDGIFVDVNEAFVRCTGYAREDVIGKRSEALDIFTDSIERERLTSLIRDKRYVNGMEVKCRTKTGEIMICRFSASLILMGGKPHILSTIEDITERKRAEIALKDSEEQYRSLAEQVHDGIYIYQGNHFVFVNSVISRITGYSKDELLTMNFFDLISPDDRSFVQGIAERRLRGEQVPDIYEIRVVKKDGSVRYAELAVAIILFRCEPAVLGTARDITERVHAENALRLANRKLNLLASITRHDILNNISVILGFLKITELKFKDPALLELLGKMESATTAIRSQIEFTRIYKDLGTQEPQWMDLDTVMSRSHVPRTIVLNADVHGVEVFADPMLEKVFFNLLDNSIRHGQRVTEIRVSYQQSGEELVVVWEDNGMGIAENEKERIFERGFGKNTGLGMFLVREILSLTGIMIRETGVPGTGARFEIRVPNGTFRFTGTT